MKSLVSLHEWRSNFNSALRTPNEAELQGNTSTIAGIFIKKKLDEAFDAMCERQNQEYKDSLHEILLDDLLPLRYQINQKFSDKS